MWRNVLGLAVSEGATLFSLKLLLTVALQDKEAAGYSLRMTFRLGLLALLNGELVFWCSWQCFDRWDREMLLPKLMVCAALGVLAGSLLMACVTDCQNCMVYHFVWWVGGTAAVFLLGLACFYGATPEPSWKILLDRIVPVILFGMLQRKLFSRMYGKADCYAFTICAVAECAAGLKMKEYLVHMLLAIFLLAVVQGLQGNIGRKGNLIKSVAFLPYITIAFWGLLMMTG